MWKFFFSGPDKSDPLGYSSLQIGLKQGEDFYMVAPLRLVKLDGFGPIKTVTLDFNKSDRGDRQQFQQALMDALWEQGVRPSEHKLHLGAQEKHLDDMRRIVFKQLSINP